MDPSCRGCDRVGRGMHTRRNPGDTHAGIDLDFVQLDFAAHQQSVHDDKHGQQPGEGHHF